MLDEIFLYTLLIKSNESFVAERQVLDNVWNTSTPIKIKLIINQTNEIGCELLIIYACKLKSGHNQRATYSIGPIDAN